MEAVQNKTMHSTESSSIISFINETDANEVSKEKEEELLFGGEDDGDDEEALSDDSLRLRLSDDEDAEQEESIMINRTNITECKLQSKKVEQLPISMISEERSYSSPQQVVEKVTKSDSEELTLQEYNAAINIPENSALLLNEHISSKNKPAQNDVHNLENNTAIAASESNKKLTLNICDEIESDSDEGTCKLTNNIKNESLSTLIDHNKDIIEVEILNNDLKKEISEAKLISSCDKNLEIISETSDNSCTNAISEQYKLENEILHVNNCLMTKACQNLGLTIDYADDPKEIISECNKTNPINISKLSNLDTDTIDGNSSSLNSVTKVNICDNKKLSAAMTISNNCDNSLITLSDKIAEKIKRLLTEVDNSPNTNAIKSEELGDNSSFRKDVIEYKNEKKVEIKHEDIIQSANAPRTQSIQQEASIITLVQNPSVANVKDRIEITREECNIDKTCSQVADNTISTKSPLLASINIEGNENETKDTGVIIQRRKQSRKSAIQDYTTDEDKQEEKESGRQRRKTARNAEEIIRKKYLNSDSDSSDSAEEFVTVNHKLNKNLRPASPPSLKRSRSDNECLIHNGIVKKVKMSAKSEEKDSASEFTKLNFITKFFQRDVKDILPKFTQEELEELLIQKIVETITMRSEIGQLREQARISEKNQETMRGKLQQLMKQVKDFEMVLTRNAIDRRANPEKFVAPIKINRSVGLQVSFLTESGMQNLRQIQQTSHLKSANVPNNITSTASVESNVTSPRRGIKVRSPRRSEVPTTTSTTTIAQSPVQTTPLFSTVTPAALVVAKPLESQQTLTLTNQSSGVQQLLTQPTPQQQQQQQQQQQIQSQSHQTIVLNGKIQNQINRPTLIAPKPRNNDLIDLTDEEEKSKSNMKVTTIPTTSMLEQHLSVTSKPTQCFQRVIQTLPTNVALTTQPANIKVVQSNNQPTPTALVNNINPPRLAYVMQSGVGTTRQLLITSNANQIRPVVTCRSSFSTVTYKTGISTTIANGTMRLLTTPAVSNVQINKHPAPLPDTPSYTVTPSWKLPPPAPSLKISKVSNGIVLSWNMNLSDKYADIASYQLYAYQEVTGVSPNTSLWKKVGDVRALPLPMACTLTQFSEGNNYYFAVRAVDTYSRKGQYSVPGNISL